jgi:hypothetical protein
MLCCPDCRCRICPNARGICRNENRNVYLWKIRTRSSVWPIFGSSVTVQLFLSLPRRNCRSGLEFIFHKSALYVILGPGSGSDECSRIYTSQKNSDQVFVSYSANFPMAGDASWSDSFVFTEWTKEPIAQARRCLRLRNSCRHGCCTRDSQARNLGSLC